MSDWTYLLGSERYRSFASHCGGIAPSPASGVPAPVLLHEHNAALAASILRSVALLEVPLRNVLSTGMQAIADQSGASGRPWYECRLPSKLEADDFAKSDVLKAIRKGENTARRHGRRMVPGDVIAGFTLGFWTKLLSSGCDDLWPRALYRQFPSWGGVVFDGAPASDSPRHRRWLHQRLAHITLQRNRCAHNDRVFDSDLPLLRKYLISASGVISPPLAGRVRESWSAEKVARTSPLAPGVDS